MTVSYTRRACVAGRSVPGRRSGRDASPGRRTKRALISLVVLGLGSVTAVTLLVAIVAATSEPTYAVGDIQARLQRDPQVWVGRTVRVRGVLIGMSVDCPPAKMCVYPQWVLNAACGKRCRFAHWDVIMPDTRVVGAVTTGLHTTIMAPPLVVVGNVHGGSGADPVTVLLYRLSRLPFLQLLLPHVVPSTIYWVRLLAPTHCVTSIGVPCSPQAVLLR